MRGFVGISQSNSVEQAVEEATKGLKKADLLILTAPYKIAEEAALLISSKYPGVPLIGATGPSITKGKVCNSGITLTAFAGITVESGIIRDTDKKPIVSMPQFEQALERINACSENTICMEFSTGNEEKTLSTINTILSDYNIKLAGGTTCQTPLGDKKIVIYNGKVYDKSCVYAIIKNNSGHIRLYKENIYERLSKQAHHATLVDTNTKTLFQLDEEPAFDVYTREVGCERDEIVGKMPYYPLGRALADETIILSTTSLDSNGVMFNGKALYDNDSIYVMKLGDYRQIHSTYNETLMDENNISFIYCIESLNRIKLFEEEDYLEEYFKSFNSLGKYSGFLCEGEQHCNQHMNQTLITIVFE